MGDLSLLEFYTENVCLNCDYNRDQIAPVLGTKWRLTAPFHCSISHISLILQQERIRECAFLSPVHFHILLRDNETVGAGMSPPVMEQKVAPQFKELSERNVSCKLVVRLLNYQTTK